jgi:hypothetical protein
MKRKKPEEDLEEVLRILRVPPLDEAPRPWMERASAWLNRQEAARERGGVARAVAGAGRRAATIWQEVRASLVLDTAGVALQGIRGADAPRQLLFEAPMGSVHIRISAISAQRVRILGQFLPKDPSVLEGPVRIILRGGPKEIARRLAPTGEFRFDSVPRTQAQFCLEWSNQRLTLSDVRLEPRTAGS